MSKKKKRKHLIPVLSFSIAEMSRLVGDKMVPVPPEECVGIDSQPSRNMALIRASDGRKIHAFRAEDVLKQKGGGGGGNTGNKRGGTGKCQPYCERNEQILCEYKPEGGLLFLNKDNKWVLRYFTSRPGTEDLSRRLYDLLHEIAKSIYDSYNRYDMMSGSPEKFPDYYEDKSGSQLEDVDAWDILINETLAKMIETTAITQYTLKIDEKMERERLVIKD